MREKKYANVLLEDEDKDKIEKIKNIDGEDSDEGKLSLTRELKFKELQELEDRLTEEDLNKELNDDYDLTDTSERKIINKKFEDFFDENKSSVPFIAERDIGDDLLMPKDNGTKRIVKAYASKDDKKEDVVEDDGKKKIESSKKNEDDIYLTRAFQPLRKRFSFSRFLVSLLALLNIAALLFIIYAFFAKPLYQLYINSKPEMVFSNTIDYVFDKLDGFVDSELGENGFYEDFSISANIKSGNVDIINLKDYSYGFGIGNSSKDKMSELSFFMKQGSTKTGYRFIVDDDKYFMNAIGSDNYYKVEDNDDSEFNTDIFKVIEELNIVSDIEDYKYVLDFYRNFIKDVVKEQKITSAKDVIEVKGEEINVTRNTLELNKESWDRIVDKYIERVFEDEMLLEIMMRIDEMTKDEYKEYLNEMYDEEDLKQYINIYTIKGVQIVGFDIEEEGFRIFYFYRNTNEDFSAYINLSEECDKDDKECNSADNRDTYSLEGTKNSENTSVKIFNNDKEVLNLIVRKFTNDEIDLDYNFKYEDEYFAGTIKGTDDGEKAVVDISLKYEELDMVLTVFTDKDINHVFERISEEKQFEYDEDKFLNEINNKDIIKI